ncbi:MAG: pyridoxamine 5'-phosphate oxidase family protein [Phenylobacterium sp.]
MSTDNILDVKKRLWKAIGERHGTGMLGMMDSGHHFQPMTAFVEEEARQIWFFTRKETDLAQAATGGLAMFVIQTGDLQACLGGRLSAAFDRTRMDKYWNSVVAAWYPGGKDDPNLTMLRLDLEDAEVWISANPVKFAWEIAKANATHTTPDAGDQAHIDFH